MKRLSLVLLVMVMVALVTSCATAATNVWLGDQVKTNSVKSTNYVQLMVQRPGTAGTGSNGLWRLIEAEDFISSLSLPQKNAVNTWTTSNIFNQHIWLADGKRLFVNGASLALDDGTGDTILNTFDDIRFQQTGVDKLVLSNGVLYGDGAGLTNVPGTGGGNNFNPNQFETNGASQVQIKSSASVTNLDAKGVTTASGITLDTGELQSDGRWLLGLEGDHIDWVDLIGGGSWMKLYTNGGVQLDKLTNGTLTVKTQAFVSALTMTNAIKWDGTGDFEFWRLGDGNGSIFMNDWVQGGLNGSFQWRDRTYSASNLVMALDVTPGGQSYWRIYRNAGWVDASNYERGTIYHGANGMVIGTERAGSGATNSMVLIFQTDGTNRMTINQFGNVGIGTTTPTNILSVNGSASATSFYVPSVVKIGNGSGAPFITMPSTYGLVFAEYGQDGSDWRSMGTTIDGTPTITLVAEGSNPHFGSKFNDSLKINKRKIIRPQRVSDATNDWISIIGQSAYTNATNFANGGGINIIGGNSAVTNGNGGDIVIQAGSGYGTNGAVSIQPTNGNVRIGGTTTITNLDLTGVSGFVPKTITNTWYSTDSAGTAVVTNIQVFTQGILTSWKQNGSEL